MKKNIFSRLIFWRKKDTVKTPINLSKEIEELGNGYYRALAQRFKTAQILVFILLFLFTTVFVLANSDSITYENLYYFVKDFRTAVDNADESGTAVIYETDRNTVFATYKGGLAVAGNERLQLYTASGYLNSSSTLSFVSPRLSATSSRLLIYEAGGTACEIYNSFTKIHAMTEDAKIRQAYLSESGVYSVITEDDEYISSIHIYNERFHKVNRHRMNSYVVAAPISENGKSIAILSYTCEGGVYETRLRIARVGSDTVETEYSVKDAFPLGVSFFSLDNAVLLLTDKAVLRITAQGEAVECMTFDRVDVDRFFFSETNLFVFLKNQKELSLIAFDNKGKTVYNTPISQNVRDVFAYHSCLYYRVDAELIRININTGRTTRIACNNEGTLLAISDHRVLVCGSGEAIYYRFGY